MRLKKFKTPVDFTIAGICIVVMCVLVVSVVWQVFSRYVLNEPSTMTDEIARFSLIWIGLLGAAYTAGAQKHLAIDLFTAQFTGLRRLLNQIFINLCILGFASFTMVWGGIRLLLKVFATGQVSPAMQVPMGYIYLVLPVSGAIIAYYSLLFIVDQLLEHRSNKRPPSTTSLEKT